MPQELSDEALVLALQDPEGRRDLRVLLEVVLRLQARLQAVQEQPQDREAAAVQRLRERAARSK
jgi:hypothetical protein